MLLECCVHFKDRLSRLHLPLHFCFYFVLLYFVRYNALISSLAGRAHIEIFAIILLLTLLFRSMVYSDNLRFNTACFCFRP